MKIRTRIEMLAAVLVAVTITGSSVLTYGAEAGEKTKFDPAKYGLYPSDKDFKARWEKVKHKYITSWQKKVANPKEQEAFVAAWGKGSPITRAMLTEVLMTMEGTARKDTPMRVLKLAKSMDKDWPRLSGTMQNKTFGSVASMRKKCKGLRDWRSMSAHLRAVAMACEYPKGIKPLERPFVWTTRAELPELKKRLKTDPWKTWYRLVVKISDSAMAGKDGSEDEELRMRFPARRYGAHGHGADCHLPNALECLALRYYIEGRKDCGEKVKELLLKADSWKHVWSKSDFGFFRYRMQPKLPKLPAWLSVGAWPTGDEVCAYDLTADLFTPEERLDVERTFMYRAAAYVAHTGPTVNCQSMRYSLAAAGTLSLAVNWKEGVDRLLKAMKGYKYKETPPHYWSYSLHTFHNLVGEWLVAYQHMYKTNPLAGRADLASSLRHYVSVCGPFADTPGFGDMADMQAMIAYCFWEMNLMPEPTRGMLMWNWQRAGDPRIVMTPATDAKRLTGGKFPVCPRTWTVMHDQYDTSKRERRFAVGEAKLVRAILGFKTFPKPVAPPVTYIAPKTGVVVLRSGLEPDDLHIICHTKRCGPLGVHGRRDTLSLQMYAYGSPVIVHPGYHGIMYFAQAGKAVVKTPPSPCKTWDGFNGAPLSYRSGIWANSVAAIGVNGGLAGGKAGYWLRHEKAKGMPVEAVVSNSGDGYFGRANRKDHFRRLIMLVKPDKAEAGKPKGYFVLVDDVLTTKPDADTHWLLQPRGTKVEGDDDTKTWTSYDFLNIPPKPVRLLVHWVRPPKSKVEMKMGLWIPFPDPDGEERPFPDIQWKGPGRMITVLYPLAEGMKAPKIVDLPGRKGVKVGGDTIEADAGKVTFKRGGKVFVVELKPSVTNKVKK
jgi:hypothetical protein